MYSPREIPGLQPLSVMAFLLRPRIPIREGVEMLEIPYSNNDQNGGDLQTDSRAQSRGDQVENTTG